ncbi:MAG TPA: aspartyl protease family protein [Candidatus Acidoferrum sp.]|nr:aspartyl protease family protein [Candidatus Acidoferrum sp.]
MNSFSTWPCVLLIGSALFDTSAATSNVIATIPITQNRGQIMVLARVNGSEPLSFMLDTGFSMTMLRRELAEQLNLTRLGEVTVEGIAGEERAPTYQGAVFDIGGARFAPSRVGAMPATRRKRDGIIGSGLFRQYVLLVDVGAKSLTIINPTNFTYAGSGEVVPLRFPRRGTTPVIDAVIQLTNGTSVRGAFEIDTGCDSGVCLGSEFTRTNKLIEIDATRSGSKFGVGGGTTTRSGHLPQLQIGSLKIDRPEADFFLEGSPAGRGMAGHIGMEVLKHFRIYFDYSRQGMIMERLDGTAR